MKPLILFFFLVADRVQAAPRKTSRARCATSASMVCFDPLVRGKAPSPSAAVDVLKDRALPAYIVCGRPEGLKSCRSTPSRRQAHTNLSCGRTAEVQGGAQETCLRRDFTWVSQRHGMPHAIGPFPSYTARVTSKACPMLNVRRNSNVIPEKYCPLQSLTVCFCC